MTTTQCEEEICGGFYSSMLTLNWTWKCLLSSASSKTERSIMHRHVVTDGLNCMMGGFKDNDGQLNGGS